MDHNQPVDHNQFVESFRVFLDEVVERSRQAASEGSPTLHDVLAEHLGADPGGMPVTGDQFDNHQLVNVDVAVTAMIEQHGGGRVVGVGGGDMRHHVSFGDLIQHSSRWRHHPVAAVERANLATGPDSSRQAVAFGVHLFRYDGRPVAVLQRRGAPMYGREKASLEVLADPSVAAALLADVRRLMVERSVFRGQVLSFGGNEYEPGAGYITFHRRPTLEAGDLVLPPGTLGRVERHVAGVARHRERLRDAGQHLKRGVLLYGPPGTGKTLTVRYLLSALPDVTTVLLSGVALRFMTAAAELARALQPAMVVLEDCDLVAEDRDFGDGGPRPLLFEVLEALDGLSDDADVAFLLTTNRVDLLERALSQRPGRVDLAVEIPLPDAPARLALLRLYARGLPLEEDALAAAATRADGTTASFAKELLRRAVLLGAEEGRPVEAGDLHRALDELLADGQQLTRSLLGTPAREKGPRAFGRFSPAPGPGLYPG